MSDEQTSKETKGQDKKLPQMRRGAMLGPERVLKKTRFAKLLLQPDKRYTREEICSIIGISENTYYKWSKDPSLPELAGIEPGLNNMRAKLYASQIKEKALMALEKVMENDNNGLARVRAAEIILGYDTSMEDQPDESDKEEAAALVANMNPVFVVADQDTLSKLSSGKNDSNQAEEEPYIEGEYTEIDDT